MIFVSPHALGPILEVMPAALAFSAQCYCPKNLRQGSQLLFAAKTEANPPSAKAP